MRLTLRIVDVSNRLQTHVHIDIYNLTFKVGEEFESDLIFSLTDGWALWAVFEVVLFLPLKYIFF